MPLLLEVNEIVGWGLHSLEFPPSPSKGPCTARTLPEYPLQLIQKSLWHTISPECKEEDQVGGPFTM